MADLTDFQKDAVEMISSDDESPTAVIQMGDEGGANMLLNDGKFATQGPNPQFDLLASAQDQIAAERQEAEQNPAAFLDDVVVLELL